MLSKKRFFSTGILILVLTACSSKHEEKGTSGQGPNSEKPTLTLSEEAYLRKLSFHLRGIPPRAEEYTALASAIESGLAQVYLAKKKKEYFSSVYYIEKMNQRLNDLFLNRPDYSHPEWPAPAEKRAREERPEDYSQFKTLNSMNNLFRTMLQNNQSWDTLLLGREYKIFNMTKDPSKNGSESMDDAGYFKSISKEQVPPTLNDPSHFFRDKREDGVTSMVIGFTDDQPQVAGAVTTARFFNRYATTVVNKNRRRAAALFRMFLCDSMVAVSVDQKNKLEPIFDLIFPNRKKEDQPVQTVDSEKPHGTDPDCMKCHYKLDPMGSVFDTSPFTLNPFAAEGALVYKNSKDELVDVKVKGLRGLAKAIVQQPEYVNCQVQHFWNWFIGEDVALSADRQRQLAEAFENNGRRVNDFISYLTEQPEFGASLSIAPPPSLTSQVQTIFQRCDSCHLNDAKKVPALAVFPIGGSREIMDSKWVPKISRELDLGGDGSKAEMPPRNSSWKMSKFERESIKKWIQIGAPLEGGE